MSADSEDRVKSRGTWTYVQKVKSGKKSFYVNVTCHGELPSDAVELAGGVCAKARCKTKPVCFRQITFHDGHRAFEFSCSPHRNKLAGKD